VSDKLTLVEVLHVLLPEVLVLLLYVLQDVLNLSVVGLVQILEDLVSNLVETRIHLLELILRAALNVVLPEINLLDDGELFLQGVSEALSLAGGSHRA